MKVALAILGILVAPNFAGATVQPTSLTDAVAFVIGNSPQLRGQDSLAGLARRDRWLRLVPNEPMFTFSDTDDDTARSYGVSLTVPFPGKVLASTRADAARARGAEAELLAKRYDLGKSVALAYLDCASAQEGYALQQSTSFDLDTIASSLRALYEGGRSSQAEKIGAELQARQSRLDLVAARDRKATSCRKFGDFLSKASGDPGISLPERLALPDDADPALLASLGDETSDRARAQASLDTAEAASYTAWWAQTPDLVLGAQRNHYVYLPGSPAGKIWTTSYSVGITVPIFAPLHEVVEGIRTKRQSAIDGNAAELLLAASSADEDDAAHEYLRQRQRLAELRRHDLPLAEAWFESTYSSYRAGKAGFSDLVLARKTLTDLKNQDIQLRVSLIGAHLRCLSHCDAEVSHE